MLSVLRFGGQERTEKFGSVAVPPRCDSSAKTRSSTKATKVTEFAEKSKKLSLCGFNDLCSEDVCSAGILPAWYECRLEVGATVAFSWLLGARQQAGMNDRHQNGASAGRHDPLHPPADRSDLRTLSFKKPSAGKGPTRAGG